MATVVRLSDREVESLRGLPLGARVMYTEELRRYVDYQTGEVGRTRRISWRGLAELLEVEPHQGLTESGKPGEQQVRRLSKWLEKAGLVVNRSDIVSKRLVFFLPLADLDYSVSKKPDSNPTVTRQYQADSDSVGGKTSNSEGSDGFEHDKPTVTRQYPEGEKPTHINSLVNTERDTAREENSGETPGLAVQLLVAARKLGVAVAHSANPEVQEWVSLGVSLPVLEQGVAKARGYITDGRAVPAKYLTQVLRDLVRELNGFGGGKTSAKRPRLAAVGGRRLPTWAEVPDADAHRSPSGGSPARVANGEAGDDWIE